MGSITYFSPVVTKALKGAQRSALVTGHCSGYCCTAKVDAVRHTTGTALLSLSLPSPSAQVSAASWDSLEGSRVTLLTL